MARKDERRKQMVLYLGLIALGSISVRLLMSVDLADSALMYVLLPFAGALIIAATLPDLSGKKWWHGYAEHTLIALMVFLGSSIVLFEGFVCVLFFMPIYLLIVGIAFVFSYFDARAKNRRAKLKCSLIPLALMVISLEGINEPLSFNRSETVAITVSTSLSAQEVFTNLQQPIDLQTDRHWLLDIFPMPEPTSGHPLAPGHIEEVAVRYHRWFIANEHSGAIRLHIDQADANTCRATVMSDTTLFAGYLDLESFQIDVKPDGPDNAVTLTISYQRKLDPVWYFGPLTRFAIQQTAQLLMKEVIIRG